MDGVGAMFGKIVQFVRRSEPLSTETRRARFATRLAVVALALSALAALPGCHRHTDAASEAAAVGGPFQMVDQNGLPRTQAMLNGHWTVVFFGYTFCPDVCPTTLTTLGKAVDLLGPKASQVQVVFVTVDPARDTPAKLKTYLSSPVFPKGVVGLTGSPAQVALAAKAYKVFYQKEGTGEDYSMDHSTALYLMDPRGGFRRVIADGLTPDEVASQISDAMRES